MRSRSQRKSVSLASHEALIESFAHDGRGVTHLDGKAVFIDGALPGEQVRFRYSEIRRDFAAGRVEEVLLAAPDRVEPACPHFAICGGCSLQHLAGNAQISVKQQLLLEQFQRIGKTAPAEILPPLTGPSWGYRRKARLGVKWVAKKGKVLVGFREKGSALLADLESCPVLHPAVGAHLRDIGEMIEALSIRDRLPQIEVAVGDSRTALVFRILADPSSIDLDLLRSFAGRFDFDVYLQRQGPDSIIPLAPPDAPMLTYAMPDLEIEFAFMPTDFTQVNTDINLAMVERVMALLNPTPGDRILDLFCGLGNFTLPLAKRADAVVGVEGSETSVQRARENASRNSIGNTEFHIADLTQPQDGMPWATGRYDKVLLDPSRAGAAEILAYAKYWNASRLVYVSCNPSTLARDAGLLTHDLGYRLVQAGVMDMFPHTAHVESIALFERC